MKQALSLLGVVAAALYAIHFGFGYGIAYSVSYGAVTIMAAGISATFCWLWIKRTTPLALGMSFSWAGAASVLGWWWLYAALDQPQAMQESATLFMFVALYFVGAILHFTVIQSSLRLPRLAFAFPVIGSLLLSALIHALI